MNWATAIVLIVAIGAIVGVFRARYRAQAGIIADEDGNERYIERSDANAQREVEELRERIKVLERIATDANTSEARKIAAISDEIESLRDK
ncbi:hypothetical protein [Pontixanthobacter aquaemixtae]|uniref:Phage shock protein B n=1 Tax=Pontixanthobacter aquaemixtae TaxID=1958940 RepID=A0A844ZSW4_9SPHN|nr:hypothetical protein [Pontixanthobacter aquaemixtae]MXO90945.1 hypothetical protein [Pontixanthobacter aquaemixtae]